MLKKYSEILNLKLKKSLKYVLIPVFVFLSISLIRNVIKISDAGKRINEEEKKVEKLKEENEELEKKLNEVINDDYIEKELRDKLGLAKEGETVVVLPPEDVVKSLAPQEVREEETLPEPNWKKWLNLFN